jgi:prophage regulatory protein
MLRLLRLQEVCARRGERPTSIYKAIKDKRLTPPVKISARTSVWPEHEIEQVNAAVVAGRSCEELRALVRSLVAARTQAAA